MRPLYDDGASKAQEATRDYVLKSDGSNGQAPLVNIFGGKITTYRRLAECMLEKIEDLLGSKGKPWTADAPLPGGDFSVAGFDARGREAEGAPTPFSTCAHARRLTRLYGTRAHDAARPRADRQADLGRKFGADLYEAEVRYLIEQRMGA